MVLDDNNVTGFRLVHDAYQNLIYPVARRNYPVYTYLVQLLLLELCFTTIHVCVRISLFCALSFVFSVIILLGITRQCNVHFTFWFVKVDIDLLDTKVKFASNPFKLETKLTSWFFEYC